MNDTKAMHNVRDKEGRICLSLFTVMLKGQQMYSIFQKKKYMVKIAAVLRACILYASLQRGTLVTLVLMVLSITTVWSQDNLHFSVDRPGISDFPTIIPTGNLQIETGIEYYQRGDHRAIFLPTITLRTAITRNLELRLTNRFLRIDSLQENPDDKHYYYGAVELKGVLWRERGWIPATSILGGYSITPNTTRKLAGPLWGNYALLLMENNLSEKIVFNYNTGVTWNGYSGNASAMYSFTVEYELSTRHEIFMEQSTFFNGDEQNDFWFNLGYTHLAAKHSQIDISGGINPNGGDPDFFIAVGYSTRIPYKSEESESR